MVWLEYQITCHTNCAAANKPCKYTSISFNVVPNGSIYAKGNYKRKVDQVDYGKLELTHSR